MCPDSHFSAFFFLFLVTPAELVVFHLVLAFLRLGTLIHLAVSPVFFLLCICTFFFHLSNLLICWHSIHASVPYCSPVRGSVINFKDLPLKETFAFLWTRRAVQLYWKAACGPWQRDTPSHPPPSTFWRTAILSSDRVTHFQIIGFLKGIYRTQITPGILFIPLTCQVSKG